MLTYSFRPARVVVAERQALRAKNVCAGCPVRRECLDWAQSTNQMYGIWGGHDEDERAAMLEGGTDLEHSAADDEAAAG